MHKNVFDKKGIEIASSLKVSFLELIITKPRKVAMMVKSLTNVGMRINPDTEKGFVISDTRKESWYEWENQFNTWIEGTARGIWS